MKGLKKVITAILIFVMALSLSACGGSPKDEASGKDGEKGSKEENSGGSGTDSEAGTQEDSGNGQAEGTGESLVIYSNSVSDGRGEWLAERAAQDGFKVDFLDVGAAELQSRLIAEKEAPIADVVFGLNAIIWESLKKEDILVNYVPSWSGEITEGLNDPDGFYHAIVKQAIFLVYNQNVWSEEEAPKDWIDLWTKDEFKGKYETQAALTGGTVRNVMAGILTRYVDAGGELGISDEGWNQIKMYYENGVISESGIDLYARMEDENDPVNAGQMWSSGIEAREEQYNVKSGIVVPEAGVPYAVEGVAIVNGTKKLEEAKRFVEWFGTAQVQGEWAETFSTLPANNNAVDKANEFNQYIATLPAQEIDWALVAENIDAWMEKVELEYMP